MAKYNVWDGDGSTRPFNSLTAAGKYAYASMKRFMDKWPREELHTRVLWDSEGRSTDTYFARIHYKRRKFSYYTGKKGVYRLKADGTFGPLTADEKAIIHKVENDPKNW